MKYGKHSSFKSAIYAHLALIKPNSCTIAYLMTIFNDMSDVQITSAIKSLAKQGLIEEEFANNGNYAYSIGFYVKK